MEERLQKYLANSGIASRRKCEELILQGKIQVNGKVVTELGTKINPEKDNIKLGIISELYYKQGFKDGINFIINNMKNK